MIHNGEELSKKEKDKYDLQREILGSLFTAPERAQEKPKRTIPRNRVVSRSSAFGRPVVEPLKETKIEETFVAIKPLGAGEGGHLFVPMPKFNDFSYVMPFNILHFTFRS